MEPPPSIAASPASYSSIPPEDYRREAARRVPAHLLAFASVHLSQGAEGVKISNIFREFYPDTEEKPKETGLVKSLLGRVFPQSENDKIIGKIEELIVFLKDPQAENNEMGDAMINGAKNVLDYLKSNASTSTEIKKIEDVQKRFSQAAEPYQINLKINKLTRELLGVHGIPENIERLDEFVRNAPEEIRNKISRFLDACESLKRVNIQAFGKYDGDFGQMDSVETFDDESGELCYNECGKLNLLFDEIRGYIRDHRNPLPKEEQDFLVSVYQQIQYGSYTQNTQINNDYFESVISEGLRSGRFIPDRLSDRGKQTLLLNPQVLGKDFNTPEFSKLEMEAKLELIETKLKPEERMRLISALENDQLYLPVSGYLYHDMQKWESNEPSIPFKTAQRTLGYLSWDRKVKIERTFILDLSRANLTTDTKVKEAFHFLAIVQSMALKTNMGKAWGFLRKNPKMYENMLKVMVLHKDLLGAFNKITSLEIEKIEKKELTKKKPPIIRLPLLSKEQKVALLRAGFSENLPLSTDLSRFGIVKEPEQKAALEFIAQLHIVRKDPELVEAWQNIIAKPEVFEGMLELLACQEALIEFRNIKSLSTEEQVAMLQGGLDYTFNVYQFLLQARLELSLAP